MPFANGGGVPNAPPRHIRRGGFNSPPTFWFETQDTTLRNSFIRSPSEKLFHPCRSQGSALGRAVSVAETGFRLRLAAASDYMGKIGFLRFFRHLIPVSMLPLESWRKVAGQTQTQQQITPGASQKALSCRSYKNRSSQHPPGRELVQTVSISQLWSLSWH